MNRELQHLTLGTTSNNSAMDSWACKGEQTKCVSLIKALLIVLPVYIGLFFSVQNFYEKFKTMPVI